MQKKRICYASIVSRVKSTFNVARRPGNIAPEKPKVKMVMRGWKMALYGKKDFDKWLVQKEQAMNRNLRGRNGMKRGRLGQFDTK